MPRREIGRVPREAEPRVVAERRERPGVHGLHGHVSHARGASEAADALRRDVRVQQLASVEARDCREPLREGRVPPEADELLAEVLHRHDVRRHRSIDGAPDDHDAGPGHVAAGCADVDATRRVALEFHEPIPTVVDPRTQALEFLDVITDESQKELQAQRRAGLGRREQEELARPVDEDEPRTDDLAKGRQHAGGAGPRHKGRRPEEAAHQRRRLPIILARSPPYGQTYLGSFVG